MILPFILISLSALVIAVDDASFLGGERPFDGGDDGLFYDGIGRIIIQKFLAGDVYGALEGGEKIFYYGGPGLRYFRALEHVVRLAGAWEPEGGQAADLRWLFWQLFCWRSHFW